MSSHQESALLSGGIQLYDPSAMMEMDVQMAQGYAILLTGADELNRKKKKTNGPSNQTIMLGFSAMTEGNVIDACFGTTSGAPSARGGEKIKSVKNALSDASMNNDQLPRIAVTAYAMAFKVVITFHAEIKNMNFITKCFRYGSIQKQAIEALKGAFAPLQEALAESS